MLQAQLVKINELLRSEQLSYYLVMLYLAPKQALIFIMKSSKAGINIIIYINTMVFTFRCFGLTYGGDLQWEIQSTNGEEAEHSSKEVNK